VRCVILQLRCLLMDLSVGLELGTGLGIGVIDGCMCYDGYTWSPVKCADSLYAFAFGLFARFEIAFQL
jgi:hypothetical protein